MINSAIGNIILETEGIQYGKVVDETKTGKAVAEVILQTADERNRNGRYYSESELFPQLKAPRTVELLEAGYLRAECGHPLTKDLQRQSVIDDTRTCARFMKLWTEGKNVMAHVCGTNSALGKAFDLDLKEGLKPAWSLRALGSVEQTARGCEVRNLRVITWDNVIYPSHQGAYTQRLVSESTDVLSESVDFVLESNLQKLVSESAVIDTNDVHNTNGIVIPVVNEDVIRYIQSESANLKFVRECFDFAYSGINVSESGSKVLLTTNAGDTLVINLESYIHNELMDYASQYQQLKETF